MYISSNVHQSVRNRIARRIRSLRNDKGLTQERLAQLAGLAPRHLQKLEAGEVNATLESLVKVSIALDTDISKLFVEDIQDSEQ